MSAGELIWSNKFGMVRDWYCYNGQQAFPNLRRSPCHTSL